MPPVAAAAVALAVALDLAFEEFPARVHPVALFGRLVGRVDREWASPRAVGVLAALALPLLAAVLLGGLTAHATRLRPVAGAVVAGLVLFSTTSLRMLLSVARDVVDLSVSDVEAAREAVPALVGRDPATLSPAELRSAAVESAAENLADGFVAPLFAFVVGAQAPFVISAQVPLGVGLSVSLGVAAAATAWVKAVNTLDSMLGYESKPVGWASARLDDAVMWLPARLAAVLLAVAARDPGALRRARDWAGEPPSPNSGWPMATLAAALGGRLAKPGAYTLNPSGDLPTVEGARRGIRVVGVAGTIAAASAGVVAWY